jgi:hypothetical protein
MIPWLAPSILTCACSAHAAELQHITHNVMSCLAATLSFFPTSWPEHCTQYVIACMHIHVHLPSPLKSHMPRVHFAISGGRLNPIEPGQMALHTVPSCPPIHSPTPSCGLCVKSCGSGPPGYLGMIEVPAMGLALHSAAEGATAAAGVQQQQQ